MSTLVADIETDGLIPQMTKIHCLVTQDVLTGEVSQYYDDTLKVGLNNLRLADEIIMHNGINFDIKAIKKIYPKWDTKALITDTLIMSKTIYSNMRDVDNALLDSANYYLNRDTFVIKDNKNGGFKSAVGSHALEAWGLRLKEHKGNIETDWKVFDSTMLEYCQQDVKVTALLYDRLQKKNEFSKACFLECLTAAIVNKQIDNGITFNTKEGQHLYSVLVTKRYELQEKLKKEFPGWYEDTKTPDYYSATIIDMFSGTMNYKAPNKGELMSVLWKEYKGFLTRKNLESKIIEGPIKRKHTPFNPGSRHHMIKILKEKYQWEPTEFNISKKTKKKSIKIDASVLETLVYPEAKLFLEYDILQDRLEKLYDGAHGGYLGCVDKNNRIHGYVDTLGAEATHRASHSKPNLGQVPAVYSPYGKEFRGLFTASPGYVLIDTDASQQEMCCLAHYMCKFDDGAYAKAVSEGDKKLGTDPHSVNMRAAGLNDRDTTKTFFYALIYGAGNRKLSKITGKDGKKLKDKFYEGLPALGQVTEAAQYEATTTGFITALDGRKLTSRNAHSALNAKLQSCGAILTKRWMVIIHDKLKEVGLEDTVRQLLYVHDELLFEAPEEYAEEVSNICTSSMKEVERYYNFKCPLSAEAKIGINWSLVH